MKEKKKIVIIGLGSPGIVNGGNPPKNMFIDPLDVSGFKKMVDAYGSAVPKFRFEVSKFLVFGTGGEIDKVYLPAVIYNFDCFINRGFYKDCIIAGRFYREQTRNIMYERVGREIKG